MGAPDWRPGTMAASRARELLQICSLSWVPGFITPRSRWPGPSAPLPNCWSRLPPARALPLGTGLALSRPGIMLPLRVPPLLVPQFGIPQSLSFLPTSYSPRPDFSRRGNPGGCPHWDAGRVKTVTLIRCKPQRCSSLAVELKQVS